MKTVCAIFLLALIGVIYAAGNRDLKEEIEKELVEDILNDIEEQDQEEEFKENAEVNECEPSTFPLVERRRSRNTVKVPLKKYLELVRSAEKIKV
uniref:Arminin-like peptide 1402 n=1 Tax=Hydra viridissima TaxID=6082 RepID=R9UFF2_HYDVD|nr:arminin-like peptide 1402 [Hydra viridissima]